MQDEEQVIHIMKMYLLQIQYLLLLLKWFLLLDLLIINHLFYNLSTNNSTLPLSAAQGVTLKTLIDNINNILSCPITDNGKFLRVKGGKAVWDTVFKAEEVQF